METKKECSKCGRWLRSWEYKKARKIRDPYDRKIKAICIKCIKGE